MGRYEDNKEYLLRTGFSKSAAEVFLRVESSYINLANITDEDERLVLKRFIIITRKLFKFSQSLEDYLENEMKRKYAYEITGMYYQCLYLTTYFSDADVYCLGNDYYSRLGAFICLPENNEYINNSPLDYIYITFRYAMMKYLLPKTKVYLEPCSLEEVCKRMGADEKFYKLHQEEVESLFKFIRDNDYKDELELSDKRDITARSNYIKVFENAIKLAKKLEFKDEYLIEAKILADEMIVGNKLDYLSTSLLGKHGKDKIIFTAIVNCLLKQYNTSFPDKIKKFASLENLLEALEIKKTVYIRNKKLFDLFLSDFLHTEESLALEDMQKKAFVKTRVEYVRKKLVKVITMSLSEENSDEKLTNKINEFISDSESKELEDTEITASDGVLIARVLYTDLVADESKVKELEEQYNKMKDSERPEADVDAFAEMGFF